MTTTNTIKEQLEETWDELLTFFIQYYDINSALLTIEDAYDTYGIPKKLTEAALSDDDFLGALEERGIRIPKDSWLDKGLTPLQLAAANQLMDLVDQRSDKKKLQDLGIDTKVYNAWLKDPIFKQYVQQRAENILEENKHETNRALLDKVRAGDIKAISYLNEMTGRFTPQRANSQNFDVNTLIVQILEIIDVVVSNSDEKLEIAEQLKRLIQIRSVAGQLTGSELPEGAVGEIIEAGAEEVVIPEIVANSKHKTSYDEEGLGL